MHLEPECAQRAAQPRHLAKQLLGMRMLAKQEMPQRGNVGIERVQKPVLRHVPRRHSGLEDAVALLLFLGEDGALLVENFDQPAQHAAQRGTGS